MYKIEKWNNESEKSYIERKILMVISGRPMPLMSFAPSTSIYTYYIYIVINKVQWVDVLRCSCFWSSICARVCLIVCTGMFVCVCIFVWNLLSICVLSTV